MLEAIAAGCIPVAPDRMAYPDYIPAELLYMPDALADQNITSQNKTGKNEEVRNSEVREVQALYQKLVQILEGEIKDTALSNSDISRYTCSEVMPNYQQLFTNLISSSSS